MRTGQRLQRLQEEQNLPEQAKETHITQVAEANRKREGGENSSKREKKKGRQSPGLNQEW